MAKPPAGKESPLLAPPAKAPFAPKAPLVISKRFLFDAPATEVAAPPATPVVVLDLSVGVTDNAAALSSTATPGVLMQARLIRVAQKQATAASTSKVTPKAKHARPRNTFAALLGGWGYDAGGADGGDDNDEPSESLFRNAPGWSVWRPPGTAAGR